MRRIILFILSLLLFIFIVIAFLPTVINTSWGNHLLLSLINKKSGWTANWNSLSLSWISKQQIKGLTLQNVEEKVDIKIDELIINESLLQLVLRPFEPDAIQIKNMLLATKAGHLSLDADLHLDRDEHLLYLTGSGSTQTEKGAGNILLNIILPYSAQTLKQDKKDLLTIQAAQKIHLEAKIDHFPTIFLDQLFSKRSFSYEKLLGEQLNASLASIPSQESFFQLSLNSPNCQGELQGKIIEGEISLLQPANFQIHLTPDFFASLPNSSLKIDSTQLQLNIQNMLLPLTSQPEKEECTFALKGSLKQSPTKITINDIEIQTGELLTTFSSESCKPELHFQQTGQATINKEPLQWNLVASGHKPHLFDNLIEHTKEAIAGSARIIFNDQSSLLAAFLGEEMQIAFNQKGDLLKINAKSPRLELKEAVLEFDHQMLYSEKPLELIYSQTPQSMQQIEQSINRPLPHLTKPTEFTLVLQPFHLNYAHFKAKALNLSGRLTNNSIAIDNFGSPMDLKEISFPFEISGHDNFLKANLAASLYSQSESGPSQILSELVVQNWLTNEKPSFENANISFKSNFETLPTSLVSAFFSKEDLSTILGKFLNLTIQTNFDLKKRTEGLWKIDLHNDVVQLTGDFKIDQAIYLDPDKPKALVKWTMSPIAYEELKEKILGRNKSKELTFTHAITLTAQLNQLYWPLFVPSDKIQLNGVVTTTPFQWKNSSEALIIEGKIHSEDLQNELRINLDGSTLSQHSLFSLNISLDNLISPSNEFDLLQATSLIDFKAQQVPTYIIKSLLLLDNLHERQLKAVLGDTINAQLKSTFKGLNGTVIGSLYGQQGKASLNGQLQNGTFTLNEPFIWSIRLSPEFSSAILQEHVPLLGTAFAADQPLQLKIAPEGFSIPLLPFDIQQISIPQGTFQMNKIQFRNEGELNALLNILKPLNAATFEIWFTPLYFSIKEGLVYFERMDFLVANTYTLAAWGKWNLLDEKMDFVLGISGRSLKYAFNLPGIPNNYLLQLPVKGRKGKIKVDTKKMNTRIAAIIAQAQGGVHGKIIGGFLEIAADLKEAKPPAPTTQPFPWGNDPDSQEQSQSKSKDRTVVEDIQSTANSIIDVFKKKKDKKR